MHSGTGRFIGQAAILVAALLCVSGCGTEAWRNADGSIVTGKVSFQKEAATGRTYHLYIPTTYNPRRAYPLVVSGHGTFPFDEAAQQRDRWIEVAERYGLIVCAPDFDSATGFLGVPTDRPAPELVRDDEACTAILKEVFSR